MSPRVLILAPKSRVHYHQPYADAVRAAGGEPALDWPEAGRFAGEPEIRDFLRPYGGILIPGGADIDPARYGETPSPKIGRIDPELDEVQLSVAAYVLERDVPTLAICRGIQVMTVAAGGKLIQDIASQCPSGVEHVVPEPKDRIAHKVAVRAGSRLAELSGGETDFEVNSRHHQAAREGLGAQGPENVCPAAVEDGWVGRMSPFEIVARAPDGIVEGMEHPGAAFLVAVQWHPENLAPDGHGPSIRLFEGFVRSCR